mgnify:CR=1 FL=1
MPPIDASGMLARTIAGVPDGAERVEEQDEDQEHADRDDQPESRHRTLLVLEFTAERRVIAGRKLHVRAQRSARISSTMPPMSRPRMKTPMAGDARARIRG